MKDFSPNSVEGMSHFNEKWPKMETVTAGFWLNLWNYYAKTEDRDFGLLSSSKLGQSYLLFHDSPTDVTIWQKLSSVRLTCVGYLLLANYSQNISFSMLISWPGFSLATPILLNSTNCFLLLVNCWNLFRHEVFKTCIVRYASFVIVVDKFGGKSV